MAGKHRWALFGVIFCCFAGAMCGQQETPAPTLAVRAGRLIDVRSGKVSTNAYILVAKDRIVRVTDAAPEGVRVLDLSKYTVVPGLIDSHAHVLGDPKDQSSTANLRMSSPQKAIWGVRNLQVWLDHGFTALRDACEGDAAYGQLALRDSIDKGLIRGPRMVSAGVVFRSMADTAMTTFLRPMFDWRAASTLPTLRRRSATWCGETLSTERIGSS